MEDNILYKSTQEFLNWYNNVHGLGRRPLDIDGIIGRESNILMALVIKHNKENFNTRNHVWDEELNLVFFRTNDKFTNRYTDWFCCFTNDTVIATYCTTKAGNFYVYNPNTVGGLTGTAVLKPGQYVDTWRFTTASNWLTLWTKHPYFMQVKPVNIWRDGNKDNVINSEVSTSGLFGINLHRGGNLFSFVEKWSAACIVVPNKEWVKLLKLNLFKKDKNYTGTLIDIR